MSDVTPINGNIHVNDGEPNPKVIAALETLLEQAKSGELMGFAAVMSFSDNSVSAIWRGPYSYTVIGMIAEMMNHGIDVLKD